MEAYVRNALVEGLRGWQVTDCVVTMTRCVYAVPDGPRSCQGRSTAADFRKLTPIVLMQALDRAGTVVCDRSCARASRSRPRRSAPSFRRWADPAPPSRLRRCEANCRSSSGRADERRAADAAGLTGGEGMLESTFAGYQPVSGEQPTCKRTTPNPLKLVEYGMHGAHSAWHASV